MGERMGVDRGWLYPNYCLFSSRSAFKAEHGRSTSASGSFICEVRLVETLRRKEYGGVRENVQGCFIHSVLSDNEMFQMNESSR